MKSYYILVLDESFSVSFDGETRWSIDDLSTIEEAIEKYSGQTFQIVCKNSEARLVTFTFYSPRHRRLIAADIAKAVLAELLSKLAR